MVFPLALIGPLIGAGASLLGGAMRNSAAQRQTEQQYINDRAAAAEQRAWNIEDRDEARVYSRDVYKHLVEDSQAAGFNPLTALRNGGGASYNAAAAFAPLSRQAPVRQAPYQGHIGEAVGQAGAFLADFDPHADAAREDGSRLIQAQIENLNASTAGIRSQTLLREGRASGQPGQLSPSMPEPGQRTATNVYPAGSGMEHNPKLVDAQQWEDRYWEVGGALGAGVNVIGDIAHNDRRFKLPPGVAYGRGPTLNDIKRWWEQPWLTPPPDLFVAPMP